MESRKNNHSNFLFNSEYILDSTRIQMPKNYPEYKKFLDEEVTLLNKGDLNQLTQYYDKNNYSTLFNYNHAEQRYKFYRWVDFEQYEAESAEFMNSLKEEGD